MLKRITTTAVLAGLAGILASGPAAAEKSKDTLRMGLHEQVRIMSLVFNARPEVGLFTRAVLDALFGYNAKTSKFEGLLAESWKWLNDTTVEIKLKKGVKWHDGQEFDADDVVYSIAFLIDPKIKMRFKSSYNWMARAEKVDKYTVRIIAHRPYGAAMARLGVTTSMFPEHVHRPLKVKSDFGRMPIGTGPYKFVHVTPGKGVKVVRNENYTHAVAAKPAARIGAIEGISIPDMQTQMAQMQIGKMDFMHGVPNDLANAMLGNPKFTRSVTTGINFFYMAIDASGRSKNKPLENIKVREALMRAIDRKLLARTVVPGGNPGHVIPAICMRVQAGCDYSTEPPGFDRAKAKKLLAEAGYAKGFNVVINSFPGAYEIAEAVGGELRKVGVKAKIQKLSFAAYRKAQARGKQQILVAHWSSGGLPDASSTMNYWFAKSRKGQWSGRNYWHDEVINKLRIKGAGVMDPAKRRAIYKEAYDRPNTQRYILPIALRPGVFIHTKEIKMEKVVISPIGFRLEGISWK
jgi:peptide/nickel transport system substrate-binding protein